MDGFDLDRGDLESDALESNEVATVLVIEHDRCLVLEDGSADTALTLIAIISDDPSDWEQATSLWPRYRTSVVSEFVSGLPLVEMELKEALEVVGSAEAWAAIDFRDKRILSSEQFMEFGRDNVFAMLIDDAGGSHGFVSIHLPPWWELREQVPIAAIEQKRQTPIVKPAVDREVLFGEVFLSDLTIRILETVRSEAWQDSRAASDEQARYPFTIAVHRDWLMTPRAELEGKMPRQLLHGASVWNGQVSWGQQMRYQDGNPVIAIPNTWPGFDRAPMGLEEICLYFDLCRAVIEAGWHWCESDLGKTLMEDRELANAELSKTLQMFKHDWLAGSFEGGSAPSFIIACDRRRVPRGSGVEIQGIEGVQSEQHLANCDCPICEMMAEGMLGISFCHIDGHHLEMDNEFAFSLCETREEWEAQQQEELEFMEGMDRQQSHWEAEEERQRSDAENTLGSAWSGPNVDQPIPGDSRGHLKMAFLLTEIISELKAQDSPSEQIQRVNQAFVEYRKCDVPELVKVAEHLKNELQEIASNYPNLTSKSADFQSRIDEAIRLAQFHDDDSGTPF